MEADLRLESSLWVGNKRYRAVLTGWHFNWTEVDKKNRDKKTSRRLLYGHVTVRECRFCCRPVTNDRSNEVKSLPPHFCSSLTATFRLQVAPRTGFRSLAMKTIVSALKKCAAAGGKRAEQVKQHRHEMPFTIHTGRRGLAHDDVSQGCRSMLKTQFRHRNTPPIVEDAHKGHRVAGVRWSVLSVSLLSMDTELVLSNKKKKKIRLK